MDEEAGQNDAQDSYVSCPICSQSLKGLYQLNNHIDIAHPESMTSDFKPQGNTTQTSWSWLKSTAATAQKKVLNPIQAKALKLGSRVLQTNKISSDLDFTIQSRLNLEDVYEDVDIPDNSLLGLVCSKSSCNKIINQQSVVCQR